MKMSKQLTFKQLVETVEILVDNIKKSPHLEREFTYAIDRIVRRRQGAIPANGASEKAIELAKTLGIDLKTMTWDNQNRFDKGRKHFIFEHKHTMSDVKKKLVENPEKIEELLLNQHVIIITREEDKVLRGNGFQNARECANSAYKQCGIVEVMF